MKNYIYQALQFYARNFPVDKGKRRVVRQLVKILPAVQGKKIATLHFNDLKVACDLTMQIQQSLFFFGEYEKEESELWINKARKASVIFDIGANVGLYSLLAASANPAATIHAFEPTPFLQQAIIENANLNGLNNIIVNPLAVSNVNADVFLNICTGSDGTNEGMNFVTHSKTQEISKLVQAVTIDDYCQGNGVTSIDLMKMDIEGGEYAAFLGAQKMLKDKLIYQILFELAEWTANRSGYSSKDILRFLKDFGYQIYSTSTGEKLVGVEDDYVGNVLAVVN